MTGCEKEMVVVTSKTKQPQDAANMVTQPVCCVDPTIFEKRDVVSTLGIQLHFCWWTACCVTQKHVFLSWFGSTLCPQFHKQLKKSQLYSVHIGYVCCELLGQFCSGKTTHVNRMTSATWFFRLKNHKPAPIIVAGHPIWVATGCGPCYAHSKSGVGFAVRLGPHTVHGGFGNRNMVPDSNLVLGQGPYLDLCWWECATLVSCF